jgi:hypothetical protein
MRATQPEHRASGATDGATTLQPDTGLCVTDVRHARRMLGTGLITVSVAIIATVAAAATPARADVSNAATCRLRAHLSLSAGSYQATGSNVECRGGLAGQPVTAGGRIDMWGHYIESWNANFGCTVSWRDGIFYAQIEEALTFFGPSYLSTEGGFDMDGGPVMRVSGTGDSDGQPFSEGGVATFRPDTGQSCGSLSSGTLTQRVWFLDGGTGNAAAEEAVTRYEAQQEGDNDGQAGAGAQQQRVHGSTGSPRRPMHRPQRDRRGHKRRSPHRHAHKRGARRYASLLRR